MDIILPNRTMKALLSSIPPNSMQAILHASPANRSVLGQLVAGELAGTMLMRDAVALSRTPINTPPSYATDAGRIRFSRMPRELGFRGASPDGHTAATRLCQCEKQQVGTTSSSQSNRIDHRRCLGRSCRRKRWDRRND